MSKANVMQDRYNQYFGNVVTMALTYTGRYSTAADESFIQQWRESAGTKAAHYIENRYSKLSDNRYGEQYRILEYVAIGYYFAVHGIDPRGNEELNDQQKDKIFDLFRRAKRCYESCPQEQQDAIVFAGVFFTEMTGCTFENTPDILQITPKLPKGLVSPNNQFANVLTKGKIDGQAHYLRVDKAEAEPVLTRYTLVLDDSKNRYGNLSIFDRFTETDRNVIDAITSLYQAGNEAFTPEMVWRTITSQDKSQRVYEKNRQKVIDSIEKLSCIRVDIDVTDEWSWRNLNYISDNIKPEEQDDGIKHIVIKQNFLYTKGISVLIGNYVFDAYKLLDKPVYLEYAKAVGQVLTIPSDVLQIKRMTAGKDGKPSFGTPIQATELNLAVRGHMLRRIAAMKGLKPNQRNSPTSRCIALESYDRTQIDEDTGEKAKVHKIGLYEAAYKDSPTVSGHIDSLSYSEKQAVRQIAEAILDYWVAIDWIKGYEKVFKRVGRSTILKDYKIYPVYLPE